MHSTLALTTEGLPLGLLDQKIIARKAPSEVKKRGSRKVPIEQKESYRWLESLQVTNDRCGGGSTEVVTICDREADIYELFRLGDKIGASLLVRANFDRVVNKDVGSGENGARLWEHIKTMPVVGEYSINLPARNEDPERVAEIELRFGPFSLNAPTDFKIESDSEGKNIAMHAIYVVEKNPPADGHAKLEWMLLTNRPVTDFLGACEMVRWYGCRWRIEMFHKILKSGYRIEACRLSDGIRLSKYLAVMSIVAWRMFLITFISRTDPDLSCESLLSAEEWKVLFTRMNRCETIPKQAPTVRQVVRWIAQLGGFLARKHDGEPGTIYLWRGWKRLADLAEGWTLASGPETCG
jgi:hypothetical protein